MKIQLKCLVLDNDEYFIRGLKKFLAKLQIECRSTGSMVEFETLVRSMKPNVCIVDVDKKRLDKTYKLIYMIRSVLGKEVHIFAAMKEKDNEVVKTLLISGANDCILKSFDEQYITTKFANYLPIDKDLLEARLPMLPLPAGGAKAEILFDVDVLEVNEGGVKLLTPHLISKGTVFEGKSKVFKEIAPRQEFFSLTVTETWRESDRELGAFAEFDEADPDLMVNVRKWLARRMKEKTFEAMDVKANIAKPEKEEKKEESENKEGETEESPKDENENENAEDSHEEPDSEK